MAVVEKLPEELMTLILSKLPVKSLMRFKCVKKSWYSLIKSPHFIHLHRSSSSSFNNCFLAIRFIEEPQRRHVLSFYSYETLDDLGNEINIPISNETMASVSSSCDGIVCITNHYGQVLICNPTLGEFRSLFVPPSLGNRSGYYVDSVVLGSDPNTGQYKAVMIGVAVDYFDNDEDNYGDREARFYDFSTDTWREPVVVIPGPFHYSRSAVLLNGAFHWCPWGDSMLTFHIGNEETKFIPMPGFILHGDVCYQKQLCVSSESQLSLILYDFEGRFEICVMTEYGVEESWTRLYKIGPLPNIFHPTSFWDEHRIFLSTPEVQLVSYDLQHQNIRHFPIAGYFDLYRYSQSLVSVNGIGGDSLF